MPRLSQRRPRLAPALVLSWALSLTMLVLMFIFHQYPNLMIHHRLIPLGALMHSSYYLVRLLQSRFKPVDGLLDQNEVNSWPTNPIFTGKKEKQNYWSWPFSFSFNYLVAWNMFISGQSTLTLRWPDDRMEIISRVVYLLSLFTSFIVACQAYRTRRHEDRAKCAIGHKWTCSHCSVKSIDPAKNDMPVHPSSLLPEQVLKFILGISVVVNGILILCAFNHFGRSKPRDFYLLAAMPLCNIFHHVIRIIRIMASSARRRNLGAWPKVPIFEKRHGATLHFLYMYFMLLSYAAVSVVTIHHAGWAFWRGGHTQTTIGVLWVLEMVILLMGMRQALRIRRWESKARCVQDCHQWVCSRLCIAKGQKTFKAVKISEPEKTAEEV